MEKITIKHTVPKKAEGSYYTIGFDVARDVEKITVSYEYPGRPSVVRRDPDAVNIVDLGLQDPSGKFLGWSGSARRSVYVGEFESTSGYLTTKITPGKWKIIVGAYKVPPAGVEVTYEIAFTEKRPRWYFGDLHIHSDASDGQYDISRLAVMARKKGLDFIAIANHNNYAENLRLPHFPGLTLIPAVEWTHYQGHMNFFGPPVPFKNSFIANNVEEMLRLVKEAKELGAIVSVNHPKCDYVPYLWKDESPFDMVEVWNGPMRATNIRGIDWWTELLKSGRKIPIVGGSDFHRSFRWPKIGNPATAVFAESRTVAGILDALGKGRSYITGSASGVRLEMSCRGKIFGETVKLEAGAEFEENAEVKGNVELEFCVSNARWGTQVKVVTAHGIAATFDGRRDGSIFGSVVISERGFAYLLVTKTLLGRETICAISNPIYFE